MPPKQTARGGSRAGASSKPKSRAAGSASASTSGGPGKSQVQRTKTTASASAGMGLSDLSDLDPFADSAEEAEPRRGGVSKAQQKQAASSSSSKRRRGSADADPDVDMDDDDDNERGSDEDGEEEEEEAPAKIPPDLLTRLLHEFFERDGTRISRDANAAVARYVDVFVRETIARAAVEKESGFLEVEDLEKVAPQLLLDL